MAGALVVGTGLGACLGGFPRGLGAGVLEQHVVVAADEVVAVSEVLESEAAEKDVRGGGRSQKAGAGTGCWVLWVMRERVRVRASGVCARFPWCPTWVQLLVLLVVSCVVRGGVVALSRLRG